MITWPRFAIALLAAQTLVAGSFLYEVYGKYHLLAGCQMRLGDSQSMETQLADLEAQLDKREAALDAAEARLNGAKPQ